MMQPRDSPRIVQQQKPQQQDEFSAGAARLLMTPLMGAAARRLFPPCAARPSAARLVRSAKPAGRCTWNATARACSSARPTWTTPPAACRLRPRRYVLLCLACAVLERADPQITLHAARRAAAAAGRRAGAGRARLQLHLQAQPSGATWSRVPHPAGARRAAARGRRRRGFVHGQRRSSSPTRCTTCTGACWPACWPPCAAPPPGARQAPGHVRERLRALVQASHGADSDEGRRTPCAITWPDACWTTR
jgi:hypothetical protein